MKIDKNVVIFIKKKVSSITSFLAGNFLKDRRAVNIYVGNLSYKMTEEELEATFAPYGAVKSAKIITDRENNNRSKGFGFVEMESQEAGNEAIEQLNGKEIGGRALVVNEARPREPRPPRY